MSTIYMSQLPTLSLMEVEGDHQQKDMQGPLIQAFPTAKDPPILFPFMIDSPVVDHQLQGDQSYGDHHQQQYLRAPESNQQQFSDLMMMSGSAVFPAMPSPFQLPSTIQSIGSDMIQRSAYDPYDIGREQQRPGGSATSGGWAPAAKMKIVRKATTNEWPAGGAARKPRRRAQALQDESRQPHQPQQAAGGVVRVCSDCSTTKTPLWRSGPCGPKSLCNACGIRQRKARRAAAAAAAAAASNGGQAGGVACAAGQPAKKEKRADGDRSLPFKKRCKNMVAVDKHAAAASSSSSRATPGIAAAAMKDQDHEDQDQVADHDVLVAARPASPRESEDTSPATSVPFHAFPADEITDAAMLLMALSCGLVRS